MPYSHRLTREVLLAFEALHTLNLVRMGTRTDPTGRVHGHNKLFPRRSSSSIFLVLLKVLKSTNTKIARVPLRGSTYSRASTTSTYSCTCSYRYNNNVVVLKTVLLVQGTVPRSSCLACTCSGTAVVV